MAEKRVDIVVGAKDEASGKIKATAEKVRKELSALDTLKGGLGEESALGNTLKVFQGAGAIAGLTMAGTMLNTLATKAGELRRELNSGEKSAGQVAEEAAKSLPIFGPLVDAGRKFRAMLDGSADAVERIQSETAAVNARTEAMATSAAVVNDKWGGLPEIIRKVRQEIDTLRTPEADRAKVGIAFNAEEEKRAAVKAAEDAAKAANEAWQKADAAEAVNVAAAQRRMMAAKDAAQSGSASGSAGVGARAVDDSGPRREAAARAEREFLAANARQRADAMARDAKLQAIEKQKQDAVTDIERKAQLQRAEIERQQQREREARWAEEFKLEQDRARQRVQLATDTQRKVADIAAQMQDDRLRLAGKGFKADARATWRAAQQDIVGTLLGAVSGVSPGGGTFGAEGFLDAGARFRTAAGAVPSITAQRDQALEMQWKAKAVDHIKRALSGPSREDIAKSILPTASDALLRGLFGGTGPNLREVPPVAQIAPTPFASLREARFLTGAGLDDPTLRIAREQKALLTRATVSLERIEARMRQENVVKLFN